MERYIPTGWYQVKFKTYHQRQCMDYGAASLAPQLASLFMAGQSHGSLGIAQILTGDPHERRAIFRVSQPVPDGFYSLDDTSRIRSLKDRAFAEARIQKPILQPQFFGAPAEEFIPHYR